MGKMNRMPSLDDLTGRTRPRRRAAPQTWEQQRDIGRMYTVMYGGTVIERKKVE